MQFKSLLISNPTLNVILKPLFIASGTFIIKAVLNIYHVDFPHDWL